MTEEGVRGPQADSTIVMTQGQEAPAATVTPATRKNASHTHKTAK